MSKFDLLEKKFVQDSMKKALAASTNYLLQNLPLENEVIKDCGFLAPEVYLIIRIILVFHYSASPVVYVNRHVSDDYKLKSLFLR